MTQTLSEPRSKAEALAIDPRCSMCGWDIAIGSGDSAACMHGGRLFCQKCFQIARQTPKSKRRRRGRTRISIPVEVIPTARLIREFLRHLSPDEKGYALNLLLKMARQPIEGTVTE